MRGPIREVLHSITRPVVREVSDGAVVPLGDPLLRAVRDLYANGEQGALYYFTEDFAGLYQDAAGTTPVTEVGQPVGLMLDRRFGLERGPEMMPPNPDWDISDNPTAIVSGQRIETTDRGNVIAPAGTFNGTTWLIEFDIVRKGPLSAAVFAGGIVGASTVPTASPLGRFRTIRVNTSGSRPGEFIFGGTNEGWIIDNISIRELPGNHASQATTTARPTLQRDANGKLHLAFDGVDDWMAFSEVSGPDIYAAVGIFRDASVSAARAVISGISLPQEVGAVTSGIYGTAAYLGSSFMSPAAVPADTKGIVSAQWAGNTVQGFVAGAAPGAIAEAGASLDYLSAIAARGGSANANISLYGALVNKRVLAPAERGVVESFLASRAGITLPEGAPA